MTWLRTLGSIVAGAMPFLLLQLAFDMGVTGKPFVTPYMTYLSHFQPGTEYGARTSMTRQPQTTLRQKLACFEVWKERIQRRRDFPAAECRDRFDMMIGCTLPLKFLFALVPVGALALTRGGSGPVGSSAAVLSSIPGQSHLPGPLRVAGDRRDGIRGRPRTALPGKWATVGAVDGRGAELPDPWVDCSVPGAASATRRAGQRSPVLPLRLFEVFQRSTPAADPPAGGRPLPFLREPSDGRACVQHRRRLA